jgi:two-component system LytT family response regulator
MINNSIKVLVVDDEPLARILIIELLKDFPEFQLIGECSNGTEALKAVKENLPDLVFLDVQMPEMDGLTLLEKIQKEHLPEIIFVTAYDQFAIRAFDFHAVDYLLKPFSKERFEKALSRVKERLSNHSTINLAHRQISSLLENYQNKSAPLKRLFIKDKGKIILLEPETIDWIEADDKYLRLHTASGKSYLLRQTLNALEAELDAQAFARIHRSTIVNLARVRELNPLFNGEYVLILVNGTKLTLSRNYKNRFFEQFGKNPRI